MGVIFKKGEKLNLNESLEAELNFNQNKFENLTQNNQNMTNLNQSIIDSLFYVEFAKFVGENEEFNEEKLRIQFKQKLYEENLSELDSFKLKDNLILEMPSNHKEALEIIKKKAQFRKLDLTLLVQILTSKCLLDMANFATLFFEKQNSFINSSDILYKALFRRIIKKNQKKFAEEQFTFLQEKFEENEEHKLIKLKEKFRKLNAPEDVRTVFNEEFTKMVQMNQQSPEYNTAKNYLETIASIPYGLRTQEDLNIRRVQKILGRRS